MSLAITGTGTTINQKATVTTNPIYPFKNINVLDSIANSNLTITVTITDLATGLPTDADGTFASYGKMLTHVAPGVYTDSEASQGGATNSHYATNTLQGQILNTTTTPNTAVITVAVTDNNGQSTSDASTEVVNAVPPTNFIVNDTKTGNTIASNGTSYSGSLAFANQYIVQSNNAAISADNLNITAVTPNTFIHSGSGTDAIDVSVAGGNNILDGSTGSNFLKGSTSGTDTFFVDDRNAASDIWSTISNFHAKDALTVFGVTSASSVAQVDNQGASGYSGLTFHITTPGQTAVASFTLATFSQADLSNGRLSLTYGAEPDGTSFLSIVGLK